MKHPLPFFLFLALFGMLLFSVPGMQRASASVPCPTDDGKHLCKDACGTGEVPDPAYVCSFPGKTCCKPAGLQQNNCSGTGMHCVASAGCPTGESPVTGQVCGAGGICCQTPAGGGGGSNTTFGGGQTVTINLSNPLAFNTVEELLGNILGVLQGIIVTLALVFMVIGAVMYVTSAGNEKQTAQAKAAITAAMIGLALALAAPAFLKQIADILGWSNVPSQVGTSQSLTDIARKVLDFLLSIIGILSILMLVVGGLTYLTAAGDEGRAETGKKIVKYAIIGIIVALVSLVVVTQIASFFG